MSDSSSKPWSSNPYAPQITYWVYLGEKENFAGVLIGAIFYGRMGYGFVYRLCSPRLPSIHHLGTVILLFFQCMSALLDPSNRTRGGTKWGLVAHTAAMFSFVTIYTAMSLDLQSISYIDNREFPAGPLVYQLSISTQAISIVPNVMFPLNQWLADGLLVSSALNSVAQVSEVDYSSSCIVATLFAA